MTTILELVEFLLDYERAKPIFSEEEIVVTEVELVETFTDYLFPEDDKDGL